MQLGGLSETCSQSAAPRDGQDAKFEPAWRPYVQHIPVDHKGGESAWHPDLGTEGDHQLIKPKRTAAEQGEDEAARKAINPLASRQTISDHQAEPEFQENHKRLKADRQAREMARLRAKK
jgi:hypothetical protein